MKTIEEKAKEFAKKNVLTDVNGALSLAIQDLMIRFCKEMNEWIDVDEELPENYVRCLVDNGNDEYLVGMYIGDRWAFPNVMKSVLYNYEVKFWRPIELK